MCTDLSQCPFRYKKLQILHAEYRKFNNSNMAILLTPDDKKCQEHHASSDAVFVADQATLAHVSTQHDTWPTFCQKTSVSTHRGALWVDNCDTLYVVRAHSLFTQTKSPDGARRHSNLLRRGIHTLSAQYIAIHLKFCLATCTECAEMLFLSSQTPVTRCSLDDGLL